MRIVVLHNAEHVRATTAAHPQRLPVARTGGPPSRSCCSCRARQPDLPPPLCRGALHLASYRTRKTVSLSARSRACDRGFCRLFTRPRVFCAVAHSKE